VAEQVTLRERRLRSPAGAGGPEDLSQVADLEAVAPGELQDAVPTFLLDLVDLVEHPGGLGRGERMPAGAFGSLGADCGRIDEGRT
jgi:hypothetical protein